ncbi:hypothetical protein [Spirosoma gilvum]
MKKQLRFLVVLVVAGHLTFGQTPLSVVNVHRYIANVYGMTSNKPETGVLFELTDSTVVLATASRLKAKLKPFLEQSNDTLPPTDSLVDALALRVYRYADIKRITMHRAASPVVGLALGTGLGLIIGLSKKPHYDDLADLAIKGSVYCAQTVGYTLSSALLGMVVDGLVSKKLAKESRGPIANQVKERFRKYTIVEQINQARLYQP